MLELPNDIVWLHFEKALGVSNFQFRSAVNKNANVIGISSYMTKKQVKNYLVKIETNSFPIKSQPLSKLEKAEP